MFSNSIKRGGKEQERGGRVGATGEGGGGGRGVGNEGGKGEGRGGTG